jgi:hypothetical protein
MRINLKKTGPDEFAELTKRERILVQRLLLAARRITPAVGAPLPSGGAQP